jgi:hypothetical protein
MHDTIAGGLERLLQRQPGQGRRRLGSAMSSDMMSEEAKEHVGYF